MPAGRVGFFCDKPMLPQEMARRLRHDLIKHLDIPQPGQELELGASRVFLRRLFDSATGLCKTAAVWGFKFRRDDAWKGELDPPLSRIESLCEVLSGREAALRERLRQGGTVPVEVLDLLHEIVAGVSEFEQTCAQASPESGGDALAALDFFGFESSPLSSGVDAKRGGGGAARLPQIPEKSDRLRVLVVDDHLMLVDRLQSNATFIRRFCWATLCDRTCDCLACPERENCPRRRARTASEMVSALDRAHAAGHHVDAILMDVRFDDLDKDELLWLPDEPALNTEDRVKALQGLIIARFLRHHTTFGKIPVVLMTARSRLPEGASSLLKDMEGLQFVDDEASLDTLAARIQSLVQMNREEPAEKNYFWGSSPHVQSVRRQIEMMSLGTRTVFITGPSGSGKSSLVEQIIFPLSGRRNLVTLDLSSIPDTLVESELFGHVKGAYSGASSDRMGLIEEAEGGVLFLDEIGNLSPENQRKLLLFLQDKTVRRVGASNETRRRVDVKVIVATHLDLEDEVKAGRFRFDLYMRFAPSMRIALPPLRDRLADLPEFIDMLVHKILKSSDMQPYVEDFSRRTHHAGTMIVSFSGVLPKTGEHVAVIRFKPATRELFMSYSWPGNTRELESILDTLLLKAFYDLRAAGSMSRIIEIDPYYALSLLGGIDRSSRAALATPSPTGSVQVAPFELGAVSDFAELRKTLERRYLCAMFEACEGDLARMGERLFGDDSEEMRHKITVRMNQLGIHVRALKKKH